MVFVNCSFPKSLMFSDTVSGNLSVSLFSEIEGKWVSHPYATRTRLWFGAWSWRHLQSSWITRMPSSTQSSWGGRHPLETDVCAHSAAYVVIQLFSAETTMSSLHLLNQMVSAYFFSSLGLSMLHGLPLSSSLHIFLLFLLLNLSPSPSSTECWAVILLDSLI